MAYDPGVIDSALAAALGDEPVLIAELRLAFQEGAERALAALQAADGEEAWREAASRLKGLAASFGAVRLMAAAGTAAEAGYGQPETVVQLRHLLSRLSS